MLGNESQEGVLGFPAWPQFKTHSEFSLQTDSLKNSWVGQTWELEFIVTGHLSCLTALSSPLQLSPLHSSP